MNGVSPHSGVIEVRPWLKNAIVAMDVGFGLLAAFSVYKLVTTIKKAKQNA